MRRLVITVLVIAAVVPATRVFASETASQYPSAVTVIGGIDPLAPGSDPKHPFRVAPQNSWATGTNPSVKSVYLRLLAADPAIKGHATDLAQDGALLTDVAAQVRRAAALTPKPDLVLVQAGSGDIKCDGRDASHYPAFRAAFSAMLSQLTEALPNARIFVVGEWGSISSYVKAMLGLSIAARETHAGKGPCSLFAPASSASPGSVVPAHVAYLTKTLKGYDAQRAAACVQYPQCRYDGGAAERLATTASDLSPRYDHLSIAGNAKLAALEWAALRRSHVIP
jgi:lysophospholipase L1-like esterase